MKRSLHLLIGLLIVVLTVFAKDVEASKVRGRRLSNEKRKRKQRRVAAELTASALALPSAAFKYFALPSSSSSSSSTRRRRLEDNPNMTLADIQAILDDSIAKTNDALREHLDDPFPSNLSVAVPLGCGSSILEIYIDEIKGLSSVAITELEAQQMTEFTFPECSDQGQWGAEVDVDVGFGSTISAGGRSAAARIVGRCRGKYYDNVLTVGISSAGVTYSGRANLDGVVGPTANAIADATTLGLLKLHTPATAVTVGNIPAKLSFYRTSIEKQIEGAFRNELTQVVEPILRDCLEEYIPNMALGFLTKTYKTVVDTAFGLAETFIGQLDFLTDLLEDFEETDDDDGSGSKDKWQEFDEEEEEEEDEDDEDEEV